MLEGGKKILYFYRLKLDPLGNPIRLMFSFNFEPLRDKVLKILLRENPCIKNVTASQIQCIMGGSLCVFYFKKLNEINPIGSWIVSLPSLPTSTPSHRFLHEDMELSKF